MITSITKRDGRVVAFEEMKISEAIKKAVLRSFEDVNIEKTLKRVLDALDKKYGDKETCTVEQIQDEVENALIEGKYKLTARHYISYRTNRTRIREAKGRLMSTIKDITFLDAADNDAKRENANIDGNTAMGTMLKYGSETAKDFYLNNMIDPKVAEAHINGDIHIHDLDFYSLTLTCCQIDLLKLFHGGFSTGHGFLREPNDIRSYASLACIAIQADQNDMHGGQSIPNFDYAMAEGVLKTYKKIYRLNLIKLLDYELDESHEQVITDLLHSLDDLGISPRYLNDSFTPIISQELKKLYPTLNLEKLMRNVVTDSNVEIKKQTYQAMEALIHNLNTMHSRAGAQVPFSSLNYGTDTSEEGRLAMDCLLDATIAGLGHGETPIFPIQIFKVKDGISYKKGDKNYDLFLKSCYCSGKRLFPNFSFLDAPYNLQYYKEGDYNSEVAYMGCRTRVMANVYDPTKEVTCGRGNLSFSSINLVRLGIEHKNLDEFFKALDEMMDLVVKELLDRLEVQMHKKVFNFPFLMSQGVWIDSETLNWDDEVKDIIKNGTLSIGFIGLAECLVALTGFHHGENEKSQELGLKIIGFMRHKMDEMCEKTHLNFSLLATPAEGLSGRFVKIDKVKYGIIKGVTDREFYTNSFHVPVYYPISIFKKIDIEAPYHALTNAGHISYVEVDGDVAKNVPAFEKIIRHMKEKGMGYASVNHPIDRDPVCGFNGIIDNVCPQCGRKEEDGPVGFERIRRITGYLVGTLDRFNSAKKAEVDARVKHTVNFNED